MVMCTVLCNVSFFTSDTANLWDIDGKLSLKIISACNLNVSKDASVSSDINTYFATFVRMYVPGETTEKVMLVHHALCIHICMYVCTHVVVWIHRQFIS